MRSVLLVLAFAAVALSACGGGGDDEDEKDTPTPRGAGSTETEARATRTPRPDRTPITRGPSTVAASPSPGGPGTSRSNPAAIGTAIDVGGWSLVVNSVTPNATAKLAAANQFNDPPAAGNQFFMANISAKYVGNGKDESSSLLDDLDIASVGTSSVSYEQYDDSCGLVPDELDTFREVFVGGTLTGNLCWEIVSADAPGMALFVDVYFDSTRAWLSLH